MIVDGWTTTWRRRGPGAVPEADGDHAERKMEIKAQDKGPYHVTYLIACDVNPLCILFC